MKAWKRFLLLLICFVVYLCGGAMLFRLLEEGAQLTLSREVRKLHDEFLLDHPCVTSGEFVAIADASYRTWQDNVDWRRINESDPITFKWTLANSFFFSATIITTIGYGHQTPTSRISRIVFIPYALIGIPLTGLLLGAIGTMFEGVWKSAMLRLFDVMGVIESPTYRKSVCILIMVTAVYAIIIVLPSLVFSYTEHWDWSQAHYFTFSSISTVGFGDFVAAYDPYQDSLYLTVYKLSTIAFIVLGLSVLAILLRIVQEYQERKFVSKVSKVTESLTSKVKGNYKKRSKLQTSNDSKGNNVDEDGGTRVCLTKAAFVIDEVGPSGDVYHTSENGFTTAVDRGMQTDQAGSIDTSQVKQSLLGHQFPAPLAETGSPTSSGVAVIENNATENTPL